MYSFGVSSWYGVGMSNWSVYKRVGICMYWGMSVSMSIWKSSIGYYWCLYFDWFWSFYFDGLYGWEGIGQSWEGVVSIYSWSAISCPGSGWRARRSPAATRSSSPPPGRRSSRTGASLSRLPPLPSLRLLLNLTSLVTTESSTQWTKS